MTESSSSTVLSALRGAGLRCLHLRALAARAPALRRLRLPPAVVRRGRKIALVVAVVLAALSAAGGAVWWRLASGPLSMDLVTPWMIAALEERFGGTYRIEVGGTVLERDEDGRTALRLRDIVLRDSAGAVVASAPRAEVGIAGSSVLTGHLRAERLSLIGAQMAVRIERDGRLTVFAGSAGDAALHGGTAAATAEPPASGGSPSGAETAQGGSSPSPNLFATFIGWLQSLDRVGLDGRDLMEIGLKNGAITVDDRRTGRQLSFGNINLSLTRLDRGGVAFAVSSMGTDGPWSLNATVTSRDDGGRTVEAVIRDVSPKDVLLALRLDGGAFQADVPLSAVIRADVAGDGTLQGMHGRIIAGAGYLGDVADREARILIDEAQAELRWDAANRVLNAPFEIHAGTNRIALMASIEPPQDAAGRWSFAVSNGTVALAAGRAQEAPLVLDRIALRAAYDAAKRRIAIEQADLRGPSGGVALSGTIDWSDSGARVALGLAGTRMPVSAFKRLWPAIVAPGLRSWVDQHLLSGIVERVEIAVNAPLPALLPNGPSLPQDGLSIEVMLRGAAVRPVDGLPAVKDAEILTRVVDRSATVTFGPSHIDLPSGRRLNVSAGTFKVNDIAADPPIGRAELAMDGPVDGAAELLAMEPIKAAAVLSLDPATSRGAVTAQMIITLPLKKELPRQSVTYSVEADLSGFSADRLVRGQKAEAASLHVSATHNGLQIKGDMKIAGTPAAVDYRLVRGESEAELRAQAMLDDEARARLGLDFDDKLSGPVPVKLNGRIRLGDREGRLAVEADLTQAKVTELLPGWNKSPGRPARMTFVLVDRGQSMRLEEFALDGAGVNVKGAVELGAGGEILHANLPTFVVSDGDKASLKADRTSDGALKVVLRGDLFDGRGLIKSGIMGHKPEGRTHRAPDVDLDIKLGAITGYHGEALRGVELRLSRRGGQIRSFSLAAGIGANARLSGEMRSRGNGRQVIYIETTDAGALFRLADIYPRIFGGAMSVAMEPPTADNAPQDGLLNLRDFVVRGEPALERVASGASGDDRVAGRAGSNGGVAFSRMRVEFTRSPGRFAIRDGVVWGPSIGATVDGTLDYLRDEVRLRGTFVPAYGLNNMFSRLPIVGLFLGGGANEGLLGITYQVVGSPRAPVLQVNPMSAVAPGFLRKLFEFRGADDGAGRFGEPTR